MVKNELEEIHKSLQNAIKYIEDEDFGTCLLSVYQTLMFMTRYDKFWGTKITSLNKNIVKRFVKEFKIKTV